MVLVTTIVVVTPIVLVTLLFHSTISTVCLWPYSLRLDFLYHTVQNNRVFPIHPLSDPFKVFLSYLKYSSVTSQTVLFNFLILQTLSHTTHGEHRIVSGDSSTVLSHDVA